MKGSRLGATPLKGNRCEFLVWAPERTQVDVHLLEGGRLIPLERHERGYYWAIVEHVPVGARYRFVLDGEFERPDPASRSQPASVNGPSEVVDLSYPWAAERFRGIGVSEYVLYELHVGTFTPAGTFDGIVREIERLKRLGVTAILLMPVGQFPGSRNWGYDGVFPFAVQQSYGGIRGLQQFVDRCHYADLAVVLDVVYNHLGPEGNYLWDFGPYFTDRFSTPWGPALNFDGPGSDEVRRFFIENALQWVEDFHLDGLRLDEVHAIIDTSALPFLEQLKDEVERAARRMGRKVCLFADSDKNDSRYVMDPERGGVGLHSMWCDDLHHATHSLLTKERGGRYADYGQVSHLARAWRRGLTYAGEYSEYRGRRHGRSDSRLRPEQITVGLQNHDQVGNRLMGERLSALVDFEREKLAAGVLTMSPFIPLLFMGQEYGERAPFQYFSSFGDPKLVEAVQRGRREEFESLGMNEAPPDPQSERAFSTCKLDTERCRSGHHAVLHDLYSELLTLRKELLLPRAAPPPTAHSSVFSGNYDISSDTVRTFEEEQVLFVQRDGRAFMLFNFSNELRTFSLLLPSGIWKLYLRSSDGRWSYPRRPSTEADSASVSSAQGTEFELSSSSFAIYLRTGSEPPRATSS